jgi:nitroreductase
MMDVPEAIETRKSVHAQESKPVPKQVLMRVLEAAHLAPSTSNLQPWHFVVVTDAEKRKKLSEGSFANFLAEASVVIVGWGDPKTSPRWCMIDVAIALENMVLTATSEGLGTCRVGGFDEGRIKQMLKIHDDYWIVALLVVGYSKESLILHESSPASSKEGDLSKIVSYEEFGQSAAK